MGLQGWHILLEDSEGDLLQDVTTAADESYQFRGLQPEIYFVGEAQQPGWAQTSPSEGQHLIDLSSSSDSGKDFGNKRLEPPAGGAEENKQPEETKPGRPDRFIEVLKSDDNAFREEALKFLQESDGPQSADCLIQALR